MTRLIVKAIDPDAPGSFRERQRLFEGIERLDDAQKAKDMAASVRVYNQILNLILPRLHTDDGSSVDSILDQLPARQFDELVAGVAGEVETVPPANASS